MKILCINRFNRIVCHVYVRNRTMLIEFIHLDTCKTINSIFIPLIDTIDEYFLRRCIFLVNIATATSFWIEKKNLKENLLLGREKGDNLFDVKFMKCASTSSKKKDCFSLKRKRVNGFFFAVDIFSMQTLLIFDRTFHPKITIRRNSFHFKDISKKKQPLNKFVKLIFQH